MENNKNKKLSYEEKRDLLLEYLKKECVGQENAITNRELCAMLDVEGGALRRMIHYFRLNSIPIASGVKGYYYAESKEDIIKTINHLQTRIKGTVDIVNSLKKAM